MRRPVPESGVRRLAVVARSGASLERFRGALLREAAARRHRVLAVAPDDGPWRARLAGIEGLDTRTFPLAEPGSGPFAERQSRAALVGVLAEFAPHVVLTSGVRTALPGVEAAREVAAEHVALLVNGLGALGLADGVAPSWLARRALHKRIKAAIGAADIVLFHNAPDRQRLVADGLIGPEHPHLVLPGSGVDLGHYAVAPLPPLGAGFAFLMLGRLARTSGAETFLAAAAMLKEKAPGARFQLAGARVRGGDAIAGPALERAAGAVELLGHLDDVRPAIAAAHVLVHPAPSEGLPGAVLEAMSMGRPVITTDTPGCRQTVDERVNGILVPPGDAAALAAAMESLLRRPDLLVSMARASRQKAERRFDERAIVPQVLKGLGL